MKRKHKICLVIFGGLIVAAVFVVALGTRPRHYRFVEEFHGVPDKKLDSEIRHEMLWHGETPGEMQVFSFEGSADKVLAAMHKELASDGWKLAGGDIGIVTFEKGPRSATFLNIGEMDLSQPKKCSVVLATRPTWLAEKWAGFRALWGF